MTRDIPLLRFEFFHVPEFFEPRNHIFRRVAVSKVVELWFVQRSFETLPNQTKTQSGGGGGSDDGSGGDGDGSGGGGGGDGSGGGGGV